MMSSMPMANKMGGNSSIARSAYFVAGPVPAVAIRLLSSTDGLTNITVRLTDGAAVPVTASFALNLPAQRATAFCDIPGDRLVKAVLLRDATGYVLAVLPASHRIRRGNAPGHVGETPANESNGAPVRAGELA